jgi:ATP-dependent DNA helicase RecQ
MAAAKRSAEQERAWQAVRRVVLERDEWTCRECGEPAPRDELDVHHLIPRAAGGADVASNCVTLCDGCHAGRHLNLQVSLARRTIERWAMALALFLDRGRELPEEIRAINAGLHLFGVTRFREGQMDAVLGALRGRSQLVIRPTGAGKSLCFQLPAILKSQPTTFVLSPLKTLMVDQTGGLHKRRLPATFINSDIASSEKEARYELLEQGALALIYMAPERFGERVKPQEIQRLAQHRPSFLVVDEAHLVDRWGADFRIDYSRIAEIRHQLGDPPVLAYTATAGLETQRRILDSLGVPDAQVLVSGVDRPNIALARLRESSDRRRAEIVAALLARLSGRAMIFIPTTNEGRKVQEAMAAAGCELPLFHSKLPKLEREHIQDRFSGRLQPPLNTIVTTSAFSMGVDISDVRLVVHWQHPAAVEDYLQEFGRAGRDGKPALALLFTRGAEDTGLWEWMAEASARDVVESRRRSARQARETLAGRVVRIQQMQTLVSQDERCFRAALVEVLQGPRPRRRRSAARWLLELVFSSRARIERAGVCCDHCQAELSARIRAGAYTPGDKLTRGFPHDWRKLWRGLRMALAGLLVLAIAVGTLDRRQSGSDAGAASGVFRAYVDEHDPAQSFAGVAVRPYHGYDIACAHPRRGGSSTLCLLIQPNRPGGHAVRGAYRRRGSRHFDCTGDAAGLRICRK